VAVPGRWEWTPVYFKELTIVGSNAFAMEEFEGVRKHAIEHYLSLVQAGRIDLTAMVTHRYPLEGWWDALKALSRPGDSGVVKAAFTPNPA
jgi:threonine dehydrogenase-like Zn-dependent dehydrogenase